MSASVRLHVVCSRAYLVYTFACAFVCSHEGNSSACAYSRGLLSVRLYAYQYVYVHACVRSCVSAWVFVYKRACVCVCVRCILVCVWIHLVLCVRAHACYEMRAAPLSFRTSGATWECVRKPMSRLMEEDPPC